MVSLDPESSKLSLVLMSTSATYKGVFGGPSGPSREGPGVGHKIVSDTKQMTKEREKKMSGKREKCVKKKKWKKEREKNGQK